MAVKKKAVNIEMKMAGAVKAEGNASY